MSNVKIIGPALPNIPWEDRPAGCRDVLWRSPRNPIIPRDLIPNANSIFNSAVVPFGKGFAGVFRCDDKRRTCRLHAGFSDDGYAWRLDEQPITFASGNPELPFEYGYDPRVIQFQDRYYVAWCNGYKDEPTIGLAWTKDFRAFHQMENAFLPYNRNGVLFPRQIGGRFAMLSRPSDPFHTTFGDIYYSESPDLEFWGRHRLVMKRAGGWQRTKLGAGPVPIETSEGWLLIYHGVLTSCNGMVYSAGAALLDLEKPWKVIARTASYLISPQMQYECVGDTPNVVFPCAALADSATDRIAVYYGGADTVVCLAYAKLDELVEFVKKDSMI
jgi:beta-1,4-mannooligosaccharide/beta-1,4-mannosyl-N-acetylglucosamine phosphorylase